MDTDKVILELQKRFRAPLRENYRRRIVFWQDPDREFESQIDTLELPGVQILKLTGTNNFAAKLLLSETDVERDYLVYNPIAYSDIKENWLLDIELYSETFRADLLSVRMQELNMPDTHQLRRAMREYGKFFENKDRFTKLKNLRSSYDNPWLLHMDILAVLTGAAGNSAAEIIRAVLSGELDVGENEKIQNVKKFGSEDMLWKMIGGYTGYSYDGSGNLLDFVCHIFMTALSVTMGEGILEKFDRWISPSQGQQCYSLLHEWLHGAESQAVYDLAREVEVKLNLPAFFDQMEIEALWGSECFPCINECILRRFMAEIGADVVRADALLETVEKRRTQAWYDRVRYYYDGLLQVGNMQKFYRENVGGFHIAEYEKLWKAYCDNFCKMDHYYRQFHAAFGRSLKGENTGLEDSYKNVADFVERLYKNWYLTALGGQWTSLTAEEMGTNGKLTGIPQQTEFYSRFVQPLTANSRVFVIISDALRYEVGVELTGQLIRETKGTAKITGVQSIFPSVTKFGMAALLPHRKLQLTRESKVLCDGLPTDGTANRQRVLENAHPGNVAIAYKELLSMKQAERREKIGKANVVYIYHNAIDAVGDKAVTEDQVFDACEQAISELKNLVRLIMNDMNGTNILITADHGFLYSYQPLDESDKAEKSFVSGNVLELERRYVIAEGDCDADHMLKIPLGQLNTELVGLTPLENIRMKKPGGGMNYVHGGLSLQECVVPVIEFKNQRSKQSQYGKKTELQLLSQTRKVFNSIFSLDFYQKEPVGNKITAATYEVYMADSSGMPVSDKKTIIADKTTQDGTQRVFRVRFTLKGMEFRKTDSYYLVIADKDTGLGVEKTEFTVDIAFTNDFDF